MFSWHTLVWVPESGCRPEGYMGTPALAPEDIPGKPLQREDVNRRWKHPGGVSSYCRTCRSMGAWSLTQRERTRNSLIVTLESSFVFPDALKIEGNCQAWTIWSLTEKSGKVFVLTNHLASDIKAVWRKMSSPNAALERASYSLNLFMTLKYIFVGVFIGVYKVNALQKIGEKNSF